MLDREYFLSSTGARCYYTFSIPFGFLRKTNMAAFATLVGNKCVYGR